MLTLSAYFRLPGALRQVGARDLTKRLPRIRNLAAAGFLTFAAAAAPNLLALQTATPPAAETQAGSDEPGHEQPEATPDNSSTAAAADSESLQLENRLRRELLDDRARTLDWWLAATAIFLTLFGIVVAIVGYVAFGKVRQYEAEARKSMDMSEQSARKAREFVKKTQESSEEVASLRANMNTEVAGGATTKAEEAAQDVQKAPEASLGGLAVAAAISLQRQGRIVDAIRKWQSIADIAEGNDKELGARAWFSVGYLRGEKSEFEAAVNAYDKVIELKPDFALAYSNRGKAKSVLGRHEAALADYDEAIRLKPDYADAYYSRGNAKSALGRHEAAFTDYNEAIRLKPDFAVAYNSRGIEKSARGRHEAAIADYGEAIRLKPDNAEAYNNRGVAKSALSRHEAAIADYDEAIRLKEDFALAYNNRGKENAMLGRVDAARRDYEAALVLARKAGDGDLAARVERFLESLDKERNS